MGQHFQYQMNDSTEWHDRRNRACFGWMAALDDYGTPNTEESHIYKIRFSMNEHDRTYTPLRNKLLPALVEFGNKLPFMKGRITIPELDEEFIRNFYDGHQPMEINIEGVPADFLMQALFMIRNPWYKHHIPLCMYMLEIGVPSEVAFALGSQFYMCRGLGGYGRTFSSPTGDAQVYEPEYFTPATFRAIFYGNEFNPQQEKWGVGNNLPRSGYIREGRNGVGEISEVYTGSVQQIAGHSETTLDSCVFGAGGDSFAGLNDFIKELTGTDYNINHEGFCNYASENNF